MIVRIPRRQGFCLVVYSSMALCDNLRCPIDEQKLLNLPDRYGKAAICIGFLRGVVEERAAE